MEQAWFSIFEIIRSWLTPAVIFLLVNFIIGTIALTSKTLLAHRHPSGDNVRSTASHVLHHMRSLSLPRFRSANLFIDPTTEVVKTTNTEVVKNEDEHLICRSQSETQHHPAEKGTFHEMKQAVKLNKALEEVAVDARAEDFISRFRRQLHLQRLDSLLKYKEIRNREN